MLKGIERRVHPRIKENIPVSISSEGYNIITQTKDLSCAGAYCWIDKEIALMTKLQIIMKIPNTIDENKEPKKIKCEGVVVRTEISVNVDNSVKPGYNIAVYFTNIDQKAKDSIAEFIVLRMSH